ncbi:hypothetical protein KQX54_015164 [Cotesia glomerata]|uniref:Endonuclease/exonuclease/phosphatase domain-containing protein n=1 Tax=Cotesia glomerata TaxID=32391 RepID=A0AAV7I520_COTGL|nr:hypothetical protein KQX54_015164 [Cotesia glomerata]
MGVLKAANLNHNSQEVRDNKYGSQASLKKRGRKSKAEKDIRAGNTQNINKFLKKPLQPWTSNEIETLEMDSLNGSIPNFLDDSLNNFTEYNEHPYVSTPIPNRRSNFSRVSSTPKKGGSQDIKIINNESLNRRIIPVRRRCHSADRCVECTKKERQLQIIQKEQEELKRSTEEELKAMMQEINKLKVQMSELKEKNNEAKLSPTTRKKTAQENTERFLQSLDHLRGKPPISHLTKNKNTRISPSQEQASQSNGMQNSRDGKHQKDNTDNRKDDQKIKDDKSRKRKPETMVEKPGAMRFGELKREVDERRRRRNNIVITGDFNPDCKDINNMSNWLNAEFGISTKVKKVATSQKLLIATLESINPKKVIMAQKNKLKGSNLSINDDYTRREAHVQAWIRQEMWTKRSRKGEQQKPTTCELSLVVQGHSEAKEYQRKSKQWTVSWHKEQHVQKLERQRVEAKTTARKDLEEQLFEAVKSGKTTYVIGDINARVGEETGYIDSEWEEHVGEIRRSQDKTINTESRKLLKICEEWGLHIANGRVDRD